MKKTLGQMTPDELGKIFPIILSEHKEEWSELFKTERELICRIIGKQFITRIEHIGSTAVADLISKPTIDIILEIRKHTESQRIVGALKSIDYQYIPKPENPSPHMMFVKGYTINGFKGQTYHIHVRYPGDWDEIYFRDYLKNNDAARKQYGELKRILALKYRNDRDGYTGAKTEFVKRISDFARQEQKKMTVNNDFFKQNGC